MGVLVVALASTGSGVVGGGVAGAQAGATYYYGEASAPFQRSADNERTNVNYNGQTGSSYNIPYIEFTMTFISAESNSAPPVGIAWQEVGKFVLPRGFTSGRVSADLIADQYLSWDCSGDTVINTASDSASGIQPGRASSAFQEVLLPYAREITLTDNPKISGNAGPDYKVCIAPEALEANSFYNLGAGIGNANQGTSTADTVAAYTPPTGYMVGSSEIIYPADGATVTHTRIAYSGLTPPTGYSFANFESAPTTNRLIPEPFSYTVVYHDDGRGSGNGVDTLSVSCTGASDRAFYVNSSGTDINLAATAANPNLCDRSYTPDAVPLINPSAGLSIPSFGVPTPGLSVAISCAFQVDDLCRDVTSLGGYVGDEIYTGTTHDFALKAYSVAPFAVLRLGIDVSGGVGAPIGTARVVITVRVNQDSSTATGYRIDRVEYGNVLAEEIRLNNEAFPITTPGLSAIEVPALESNVTLTREPCAAGQPEQCLVATISDITFLEAFSKPVYTITAISTKALQVTHHLN